MALKVGKDRGNWTSRNEEDEEPGLETFQRDPRGRIFLSEERSQPAECRAPRRVLGAARKAWAGVFPLTT